ncbi:hypothetical protein CapIbe_023981 [Capra ibex]
MKPLLCSLILGLLVASQGDAQIDASQFTGRWLTHYIAADNVEKITEGGPFHIFMRYIEFDEENGMIHFHFYIKKNGQCIEKYTSGLKEETHYAIDCKYECCTGKSMFSQGDAQIDASQFTGRWLTYYMAANNIEKITEGAPFYAFMRYIEFDEENGTILMHFYVKENGECIEKYVSGTKEGNFYAVDYAGHNEFRPVRVDNGALIAHVINVDEHGKETELVQLFGRGDDVGPECKEFYNTVKEKGIPEENILNFIDNATGTTSALTKERLWEHPNEGSVPEFTTWCGLWHPRRGSSAKSLRAFRAMENHIHCIQ